MLILLTCHAPNAPEIGHLLAKHPDSIFERDYAAGKITVFYPEVTEDAVTVALITEVDSVGLVRGPAALTRLDQYVNDRPYVASSLTSVALNAAFGTALAGRGKHTERVDEWMRWLVELPAVACDAGEGLIARVFAPLGYAVTAIRLPLDSHFPSWGAADLYHVALEGELTVREVLSHLYVLLPVLDNSKHYWVGEAEIEKLLAHGGSWLSARPERELITTRYLRYKRPLVFSALARLLDEEEPENAAEQAVQAALSEEIEHTEVAGVTTQEPLPGLHEQRLAAVMETIRASGAQSLADLGCGEGKLLALAMKEKGLSRIFGMDVSSAALARARRRLHLDALPEAQKHRIAVAQGSLLYRDARLHDFDVAALVEVIEHLDPPRLAAMERVVFEHARPKRVIVTTPNREYNAHWEALGTERLRHGDHRFEWTRAECQAWADRVAALYGYTAERQDIGPVDAALGAPPQMVVFDRQDGDTKHHSGHLGTGQSILLEEQTGSEEDGRREGSEA